MDQISTSNNNEVNYEIGPPFSYLLNPSDSESKFSNAVDDGDGGVSENEKKKFAGKSSDNLIDTEHRSSIGRNDVSSLSWTKNEVIANDSLVVEKNPHNALEDIEKGVESSVNTLFVFFFYLFLSPLPFFRFLNLTVRNMSCKANCKLQKLSGQILVIF